MIIFTSDIDWAEEEVITYMLDIFEEYQVKCTLFATHESQVLRKCNKDLFEIAIHPNFNPVLEGKGGNVEDILDNMMSLFPKAKGIRSHSMTQSTPLLALFAKKGLLYDANHFLPYQKIQSFKLWNGMWRIPYNWEDDIHFAYKYSFDNLQMKLNHEDLFVLDFHPIHVFLNTDCEDTYNHARKYYHDVEQLSKCKNQTKLGSKDMLIMLLETLKKEQYQFKSLLEYYNQISSK